MDDPSDTNTYDPNGGAIVKISDIPWDSNFTAKNSVLTCESNFQMKVDTQGGGKGDEGGEQDDSMSASDSYELMRCLWDKCNGCMKEEYENVDSAAFLLQTGGLENQEQQCAHDIAIHCSSEAGKNDASCKGISCASVMACKAKDSNCLCSDPDFANYFDSMMLCDRAVCLDYQHALTTHYASKGYYQPGEKWMERVLRFKNALLYPVSFHFQRNKFVFVCHFHSLTHILVLSLFLLLSLTYTPFNITSSFSFCFSSSHSSSHFQLGAPPSVDFTLDAADEKELATKKAECTQATTIEAYVQGMILFCNKGSNMHHDACRDFSPCGDGVMSWGEECDPGTNGDPAWGGCENCNYVKDGYACAAPGTVCDRCDLDQKIRNGEMGMENACPFCLNEKINGTASICDNPKCQNVLTLAKAKECDIEVEKYCDALHAVGSEDPGCINYFIKTWKISHVGRLSSAKSGVFVAQGQITGALAMDLTGVAGEPVFITAAPEFMFGSKADIVIKADGGDVTIRRSQIVSVTVESNAGKETRKWSIPRVASACTYKINELQLNSEGLVSEKIMIIDCEFVDQTKPDQEVDTTPLFWHIDPKTPVNDQSGMNADQTTKLQGILEGLSAKRGTGGLRRLTDLALEDYYPYIDPSFNVNGGAPAQAFSNNVAWWGYLVVDEPTLVPKQHWNKNKKEKAGSNQGPDGGEYVEAAPSCSYAPDTGIYNPRQ